MVCSVVGRIKDTCWSNGGISSTKTARPEPSFALNRVDIAREGDVEPTVARTYPTVVKGLPYGATTLCSASALHVQRTTADHTGDY